MNQTAFIQKQNLCELWYSHLSSSYNPNPSSLSYQFTLQEAASWLYRNANEGSEFELTSTKVPEFNFITKKTNVTGVSIALNGMAEFDWKSNPTVHVRCYDQDGNWDSDHSRFGCYIEKASITPMELTFSFTKPIKAPIIRITTTDVHYKTVSSLYTPFPSKITPNKTISSQVEEHTHQFEPLNDSQLNDFDPSFYDNDSDGVTQPYSPSAPLQAKARLSSLNTPEFYPTQTSSEFPTAIFGSLIDHQWDATDSQAFSLVTHPFSSSSTSLPLSSRGNVPGTNSKGAFGGEGSESATKSHIGLIVGIVVGFIALLIVAVGIAIYCWRTRTKNNKSNKENDTVDGAELTTTTTVTAVYTTLPEERPVHHQPSPPPPPPQQQPMYNPNPPPQPMYQALPDPQPRPQYHPSQPPPPNQPYPGARNLHQQAPDQSLLNASAPIDDSPQQNYEYHGADFNPYGGNPGDVGQYNPYQQ